MKNFNKLLFAIITVVSIGYLATSCNDKFSEEDLLKLQLQYGNEQDSLKAAQALAALNAAGELVSFQVKAVNTDGIGVEGLDVTLTAAVDGGTADNQTLTTDANGLVYFDKVIVGGNTMTISGANIMDAVLTLNFGSISDGDHYIITNGVIVPTPVHENAVITVIGTNTSTATVTGTATIQTDLTNKTPEVPQNVTIVADFDDGLSLSSSIGISYFFATNDNALNIGTGAVDNTTGVYSITVPAGVRFDLLIPDIQTTQRIAINGADGQDLARPEYRDILTNFGPSFGTDFIPTVPGAVVTFEQPADAGEGFTFGNFMPIGRAIQALTLNSNSGDPITEPYEDQTDIITQFTSLGSGYINSPAVTITDASGTGAYAEAWIETAITGLSLTSTGSGYAASTTYQFDLYYDEIDQNGTNVDQVEAFSVLGIDTDASGVFTASAVSNALAAAIANGDNYFDVTNLDQINDYVSNLRLVNTDATTDAVIDITSAMGRVYALYVFDGGSDYINPSFSFSGGGATTQASMNVLKFGTLWSFDVDNTGVTSPYTLLPSSIEFEYNPITVGSASVQSSTSVANIETGSSSSVLNLLAADGNGDIQFIDQTASYRTTFYTYEVPRVIVQETESVPAARNIRPYEINTDGQITGLSTSGYATSFTSSNGSGYMSQFAITVEPSATGAPGSGASIVVTDGTFAANGEYQWGGNIRVLNGGSGYLQDLNLQNNFIGDDNRVGYSYGGDITNVSLNEGTTHVVDITYGTGDKTVSVY